MLHRRVGPDRFAFIAQNATGQSLILDAHADAAQAIAADRTGFDVDQW